MARSNAIAELLKRREMQSPFRGHCTHPSLYQCTCASTVYLYLYNSVPVPLPVPVPDTHQSLALLLLHPAEPPPTDDHESEHTHPRLQRRQSEIQKRGFHLSTTVTVRTQFYISFTFFAYEYRTPLPRLVTT